MKNRWGRLLVVFSLLLMIVAVGVQAQGSPLLAFVNSSGQLVVSSADGGFRWIVTNPGETLVNGYHWSGSRLFFAVRDGGEISLRVGDANSQRVTEIGRGAGSTVSFGGFTQNSLIAAIDDRINIYPLNGSGGFETGVSGELVETSTDGDAIFLRGSDGNYALLSPDGANRTPLGFGNDPNSPFLSLWSDTGSLVAYADFGNGSGLAVTDANTGETVTLNSDGSIPLIPLAWAGTNLIYRGTGGVIRIADMSCLNCGSNPLENGVDLLPGSATDIQIDDAQAYFIIEDNSGNENVATVDLACVARNDCLSSMELIETLESGTTVLALSPDGSYVITSHSIDSSLNVVSLRDGGSVQLSENSDLSEARWSTP